LFINLSICFNLIFTFLLFLFPAYALKIPIPIEELEQGYTSSNYIKRIISNHNSDNLFATVLILEMGIGIVPLTASLIDDNAHITKRGKKYGWAKKMHALLKSLSSKNNSSEFIKFYNKLEKDYQKHSTAELPSAEAIKKLLKRANKTGLLCEESLVRELINKESLFPLRWVILSGQLKERIYQIEALLAELKRKEKMVKNKFAELNNKILEKPHTSFEPEDGYKAWLKPLYIELNAKIQSMNNFIF